MLQNSALNVLSRLIHRKIYGNAVYVRLSLQLLHGHICADGSVNIQELLLFELRVRFCA